MIAPPDAGKTIGPLCPICKKPYNEHSWLQKQDCNRRIKKYSNKSQSPTASYNSYKKINWTEPKPTKSGRDAVEIWNDLKHAWSSYKMYLMYDDKINMIIKAKLIRKLQDDLGMTQEKFTNTELHGIF